MSLSKKHLDFEEYSRQLLGLTLSKVEYSEILSDQTNTGQNYHTHFEGLHSVDFSVFFHTADNNLIEFYWDDSFYEFGVGIKINKDSDFRNTKIRNVSEENIWVEYIDTTITAVSISWEEIETMEAKTGQRIASIYPQDVRISFSNGKNIFISAACFLEQNDNEAYGMSDNILVTDNENTAMKVKMIH